MGQDKNYYSAPYQYIGKKLKVIYTKTMVRIFHNFDLIAVHQRSFVKGKYTTNKEHLCSTHQYYLNRSPDYYKDKAKNISTTLGHLFELIFAQNKYPEQLYRTCDGLFGLQRNTGANTFEKACHMAVEHKNYSYSFIQNIIKNRMTEYDGTEPGQALPEHKNIRGKEYYDKQLTFNL